MSDDRSPAPAAPTYRRGDHGAAVAEIRGKLGLLGLLAEGEGAELLDPAGALFDEGTDRAVRAFQQQRGISVDGVVGPQTYHALEEARWRLGDRILFFVPARLMAGDDVAALQQRLLDMGFDCGRVDGLFGVETELALREFQRNIGVTADGTCGPATFNALGRLSRTVVGGQPAAMRESEAITRGRPGAGREAGHHRPRPRRAGAGRRPRPDVRRRARLRRGLAHRGPAHRHRRVRVPHPRPGRLPGRPGRGGARPLRQRGGRRPARLAARQPS